MKLIIEKTIEEAYSSDDKIRETAILTLMDILRLEGKDEYDRVIYPSCVPWEAIFINLEEPDKEEIARSMTDIFLKLDEPCNYILWIFEHIGQIGLPYLLAIIRERHHRFSNYHSSQALSSLFSCLNLYKLLRRTQKIIFNDKIKSIVAKNDITSFLKEKSISDTLSDSNNRNLNEIKAEIEAETAASVVKSASFLLEIFRNNDLLNAR